MAKRFYQISYELGVAPRRLISELASVGLSVGNQMIVVQPALEQRILALYGTVTVPASDGESATAVLDEAPADGAEGSEESIAVAEAETAATETVEADATTVEEAPRTRVEEPARAAAVETAPPETKREHKEHHKEHKEPVGTAPASVASAEPRVAETPARLAEAPAAPVTAGRAHVAPPEAARHAPVANSPAGTASKHPAAAAAPTAPAKAGPPKVGPPTVPSGPPQKMVGARPRTQGELIPTIDPRAGRLLREAPKAPIPGVTAPRAPAGGGRPGGPGRMDNLNPALPGKAPPAPGARRDTKSRETPGDARGGERHGKQTFQLRSRKRTSSKQQEPVDQTPKSFEVTPPISVKNFSEVSGLKISDIVKTLLLKHKQVVTPNSMLDEDTIVILGVEFDRDVKFVKQETSEDQMVKEAETASKAEDLFHRPPVVVVMGHVDHGKTSLLDYIRKADVAAHEAGGITQHIGAYQVTLATGKKITFFDTPGHEAFTEMRRRGSKVTDIVVLVVAADDGVMPQTIEAIDHAKAAEVPICVAITKSDKVGFAPERVDKVKQQLAQHGIMVSGWGGEVECFPVASTGKEAGRGIDKLLEHIVLLAEVEDLKADPKRPATGTVIEAENNPGRGVLATLLVDQGTLRRGDALVAGKVWGRVRAMRDDKGQILEEAPPGTPVEVTGLDEVPEVGKPFFARPDANEAREIAEERRARDRELELAAQAKPASVEGLFSQIEQGKVKSLKVILKTDVQGSLEAIKARLDTLGNAEVKVQVIRAGVGAVSESDVTMAATYGALVIGFHVVADETARSKAKHLNVEIRMYRIIYELEEAMNAILEGKLSPEARETVLGHAEILQIFRSTKLGNIAGCRVRDGVIKRDAQVRLARNGIVVWEGKLGSLRREKDDAKEVKEGFECGIRLEGYDDIKDGDTIEAFTVEQVARTLAS